MFRRVAMRYLRPPCIQLDLLHVPACGVVSAARYSATMNKVAALREIDAIVAEHARGSAATLYRMEDFDLTSGSTIRDFTALMTRCHACVRRHAPMNSSYVTSADEYLKLGLGNWGPVEASKYLLGVLEGLRDAVDDGTLATFEEIVHADVYEDLLTQAQGLLGDGGFSRAAAVVAGAALEAHLRALADKHGIGAAQADGRPKQASMLNADLKRANAYSETQRKQVEGWQALRNEAAHGKDGFEPPNTQHRPSVPPMIDGIRAFMITFPA